MSVSVNLTGQTSLEMGGGGRKKMWKTKFSSILLVRNDNIFVIVIFYLHLYIDNSASLTLPLSLFLIIFHCN